MRPEVLVTTSWDDGHQLDERVAALLDERGLEGTFYIAPRCREIDRSERLTKDQIRALAGRFEIGAHTMTHPILTDVSLTEAKLEICDSRVWLEDVAQHPVTSFCYPRGRFTRKHVMLVHAAGFRVARTIDRHVASRPRDWLRLGTTSHAFAHKRDVLAVARVGPFRRVASRFRNWDDLAIAHFDRVAERGGIFHLWGHSWEIDRRGDWSRLVRVLDHVAAHGPAQYVTNGGLRRVCTRQPTRE